MGKSSQVKSSDSMEVTLLSLRDSGWAQVAVTPLTSVVLTHSANQRRLQSQRRLELSSLNLASLASSVTGLSWIVEITLLLRSTTSRLSRPDKAMLPILLILFPEIVSRVISSHHIIKVSDLRFLKYGVWTDV